MEDQMTSTRPYLLRAFYEWIVDNGLTPYVVVNAQNHKIDVPSSYIEDGRIVLNVSPQATDELVITNKFLDFDASFAGEVRHIHVPVSAVLAIYAKENGRGMVFSDGDDLFDDDDEGENGDNGDDDDTPPPKGDKPKLRIVK